MDAPTSGLVALMVRMPKDAVLVSLHSVLCSDLCTGIIPTDWQKGLVVPLWKGKCDRQDCSYHRAVTLLSVTGKVIARIIIDRVCHNLLEHQHPEQSIFMPKRLTIDRTLPLWVLTQRKQEF